MIKYRLICSGEHEFEGWFRDSADYDAQAKQALVECPVCGDCDVRKAIMAPSISKRSNARSERLGAISRDMAKAVERAREYVEKNFEYVGGKFPEEARKIHYGESDERGIYGEATPREVKELADEGVSIAPLPGKPKKTDQAGAVKIPASGNKKLN